MVIKYYLTVFKDRIFITNPIQINYIVCENNPTKPCIHLVQQDKYP